MSRRRREDLSSSSSQDSPLAKHHKMADVAMETPTMDMIYSLLLQVQDNTKNLNQELSDIKDSVNFTTSLVEKLAKENAELKNEQTKQKEVIDVLKGEVRNLTNKCNDLEVLQDEMHQYQRKKNNEIHGIPEEKDEDVEDIVKDLADTLDIDISLDDIDIAHRLPSKNKIHPRPIIVKFMSYSDKSDMYKARRRLKSINLQDQHSSYLNNATKIFINENLTGPRKALFAEVRKRSKQNKWHSTFTLDGKIFVKKEKEQRAIKITKQADLEYLY